MAGSGGKAPQSFGDGLDNLFMDVQALALAPDAAAHAQFIQAMGQGILKYRQVMQQQEAQQAAQQQQQLAQQQSGQQMQGVGLGQQGGQPGGGQPGQPAGAGMQGQPGANQIAPGGGAGMSGYGGVNADDLQRVLAGTGGQQ